MEQPKFVSEYPLPPSYYKSFIESQEIPTPPPIPKDEFQPYNGMILQKLVDTFDPTKDYKSIFKKLLRRLFDEFIRFLSDTPTTSDPVERRIGNIHSNLNEIYTLIAEYRTHHARALLCTEMTRQLAQLSQLEEALTKMIAEAESGLQEQKNK
mmetsp:Transcript_26981/g.27225  ORF Transcript_26981/g.27225 Transcript_26981/m.27225 type:complete len:153 (+) Transcript_26981:120-578(+)|eukprot:CAMPEP_0182428720 /NCGR_PEP_ID=MMETSP1167-20130531/23232_1 /TAXON_ID=2988 /ORGANISM="Mallomonas Sp, Strain CCMP3275" /LENGTH=152 /DNA_ID=CAMNT_0024611765 /DNA_START=105 /DNA_END=563 /DNA_ORIENTATION=-